MKYLLEHGTVITMNERREVMKDGAVAVSEGKIEAVGTSRSMQDRFPGYERIDCSGHIVLPGLIDCHGHAGHAMLRGLAADTIHAWGQAVYEVYFQHSTEEFWYYDGLLSAADRLRSGVTTSISVVGCEPRADLPVYGRMVAEGYRKAGANAVVCIGPGSQGWPKPVTRFDNGTPKQAMATWEEYMDATETLLREVQGDSRIRVFVTPFTVLPDKPTWGRTPPELCRNITAFEKMQMHEVKQLAKRYRTGIHSDAFGNLIALMARCDEPLLGPEVLLQHCHDLTMEEIGILAETGTHVGHSPEASVRFCPYAEMLEEGVNAVITTDGCAPRSGFDLFQAMRKVQMLEQYRFDDLNYMPVGTLLEGVTIQAARALGADSRIGSLEPGKQADLITVDMQKPHLVPWQGMPVHRLVLDANGHDVDNVMVEGEFKMRSRTLTGIDLGAVIDRAGQVSLDCVSAAGLSELWETPAFGKAYRSFHESGVL